MEGSPFDSEGFCRELLADGRGVLVPWRDPVAIAREGLKARGKELSLEKDETQFIDELSEIAETGITAAERLLEHYHTAWGGDVSKAYTCCAF